MVIVTSTSWIILIASVFCPGLHPGPVQAVCTIQMKMSAQNTTIWFLQRAAAWPKNHLKSLIHRCSTNPCLFTNSLIWSLCINCSISVLHNVCICYMFVPVSVNSVIFLNSSGIQFCIVGCTVFCVSSCTAHMVSFTWMHLASRSQKM